MCQSPRWSVALALGLRQGEALGLLWSDIDLDKGSLTIRRALQRQPARHGCNGNCGRKRAADCPQRQGGGLTLVEPKSDHKAWKKLLQEAGVRDARLHDA